jgi:hypothetical protein
MVTPSTTKIFVAGGPMIQNSIVVGMDVLPTLVPPPISVLSEDSQEDAVLLSNVFRYAVTSGGCKSKIKLCW